MISLVKFIVLFLSYVQFIQDETSIRKHVPVLGKILFFKNHQHGITIN